MPHFFILKISSKKKTKKVMVGNNYIFRTKDMKRGFSSVCNEPCMDTEIGTYLHLEKSAYQTEKQTFQLKRYLFSIHTFYRIRPLATLLLWSDANEKLLSKDTIEYMQLSISID
jgi:hypothetical protein